MTSIGAQRITGFRRLQDSLLMDPQGPTTDFRLYELSQKLRTEAHYLITSNTVDAAFAGFLSREKAAGRVYSSEAHARQVFSQAGVVAPPESLISGTKRFFKAGA